LRFAVRSIPRARRCAMQTMSLKRLLLLFSLLSCLAMLLLVLLNIHFTRALIDDAGDMALGKDVVADILPPPLYLIEAQLTLYQLRELAPAQQGPLRAQLARLQADYDTRNAYWAEQTLEPAVKQALLQGQQPAALRYWQYVQQQVLPRLASDPAAAAPEMAQAQQLYQAHRATVDHTVAVASRYAQARNAALQHTEQHVLFWVPLAGSFCLLVMLISLYLLQRSLYQRLGGDPRHAVSAAEQIARGDLRPATARSGHGVLGAMSRMRLLLTRLLQRVADASSELARVVPVLQQQASLTREQAQAQATHTAHAAATLEQLSAAVGQASDFALNVQGQVQETARCVRLGEQAMQHCVSGMAGVSREVGVALQQVASLGKHSERVGSIVRLINDIADQTNLLALNAAIEAARAGDHGRSFAVVADEVRKLAVRTSASTDEIQTVVASIRAQVGEASGAIVHAVQQAGEAEASTAAASQSMQRITALAESSETAVRDIGQLLGEQSRAIYDMAMQVEGIHRSADSTLQQASQQAQLAGQLVVLSSELDGQLQQFVLPG